MGFFTKPPSELSDLFSPEAKVLGLNWLGLKLSRALSSAIVFKSILQVAGRSTHEDGMQDHWVLCLAFDMKGYAVEWDEGNSEGR